MIASTKFFFFFFYNFILCYRSILMIMDGSASFHHVDVVLGSSDLPFDSIALSI